MLTTKRRQRRVIGETRGVGGVEISLCTGVPELIVALDAAPELYTVLYTIVGCGGDLFRGFRPSTSAIISLTAFVVKSMSLRSDIRFIASCTVADDGVDTDVIRRRVPGDVVQAKGTSRATDPRSVLVCSVTLFQVHAVLDEVSSEANCEDPDRRVQKLVSNRDLWSFDILSKARRLSWPSITVCDQLQPCFNGTQLGLK